VVVWVAEAPVPVMVIVKVPAGVVDAVLMVSVDELPAVTEVGLKVALAPDGSPDALSDTVCAEPEVTAVETVVVAELPWTAEPEAGLTEIEKSFAGTGLMVRE
jgi:hypothetical protein